MYAEERPEYAVFWGDWLKTVAGSCYRPGPKADVPTNSAISVHAWVLERMVDRLGREVDALTRQRDVLFRLAVNYRRVGRLEIGATVWSVEAEIRKEAGMEDSP